MDEQQSQKRGIRSEAQKEERARSGYKSIPPSKPVAGAFGDRQRETPTDQDASLSASDNDHENNRDGKQTDRSGQ